MCRAGKTLTLTILVVVLLQVLTASTVIAVGTILSVKFVPPGNGQSMLLDLGSNTCIPCKQMQPILADLKKECATRILVQVVDAYERRDLAATYRIYSIPTQIFFDAKGKELYRHVGFFAKSDIITKFKELGML